MSQSANKLVPEDFGQLGKRHQKKKDKLEHVSTPAVEEESKSSGDQKDKCESLACQVAKERWLFFLEY